MSVVSDFKGKSDFIHFSEQANHKNYIFATELTVLLNNVVNKIAVDKSIIVLK